jgi:hypothetical protein
VSGGLRQAKGGHLAPSSAPLLEVHESVPHPTEPQFEDLRRARDRHYAERSPDRYKRRAVMTITHNESLFFPIWLRYYATFFDPSDIYVLDHDSSDGSTDGEGFVRVPISHDTFDNLWMVANVERLQHELLERYDVVLVTDVDEIVAPHPAWGSLTDYIDRFDEPYVNCLGYELIHVVGREKPFDPSRAVLDQRAYWFANDVYDKPALATQPLRWQPGFHRALDAPMRLDPDLYLIHLHRLDYDVCQARHRRWAARTWEQRDLEKGWGTHNRVVEDSEFRRWFYEDTNFPWIKLVIQSIPNEWKGLF